jgi:hypothetical protein
LVLVFNEIDMDAQGNAWNIITASLENLQDESLLDLLSESQLRYDGNYIIDAKPEAYSRLCSYYPLIETVVQDNTGKHFRLNLDQSVPMGTDGDHIRVEIGASSLTDAIIKPEAIVAVPSYLLRFVPYVGAAPVLIATALRQAFYFASRETGASQLYPSEGNEVTIDVQSILNMLGNSISRAKFFRVFKSGSMDWFVIRGDAAHQFVDGQIRRLPNTYYYQGQVLCPGDTIDLAKWFDENGLKDDPLATLNKALQSSRNQILHFPYRLPNDQVESATPLSVRQVVAHKLNLSRLDPTLSGLCDRLSSHLIRPESFLAIPWYWFNHVLPELGDDLGMLYLMAKNCCYIDWARGNDRNHFWVQDGLSSLQAWINSKSLPNRIPHKTKSKRGRPRSQDIAPESQYTRDWRQANRDLARSYLLRSATRKRGSVTDWQLEVFDTSLTARDETLRQALSAFLHSLPDPVSEETLASFANNSAFQSLMLEQTKVFSTRLCHFDTLVKEGICKNETLDEEAICHFDTLVDGLNCYFETLIETEICQFDTIIKILIKIKNSLLPSTDIQLPKISSSDSKPQLDGGLSRAKDNQGGWDFDHLLREVNSSLKKRILDLKFEEGFLSWLIQTSLSPTVHSPLSLAVSKSLETGLPASKPSQRLAQMPQSELSVLISSILRRLNSGQTGRFAFVGEGAEYLAQLLIGVEDLATQKRLLQRLLDNIS